MCLLQMAFPHHGLLSSSQGGVGDSQPKGRILTRGGDGGLHEQNATTGGDTHGEALLSKATVVLRNGFYHELERQHQKAFWMKELRPCLQYSGHCG